MCVCVCVCVCKLDIVGSLAFVRQLVRRRKKSSFKLGVLLSS